MEAGSSPARTTSSRTGTPRSLSPATSEATSERTSAAAILPSSIFATSPLEDREQHGGHLLFAAHHAWQVYYAVPNLGLEGLVHRRAVPDAQELGAALYDVRDHERREQVAVLPLQVLQGVHQLVFALEEACADDLHLGDANLVSRARPVLLASRPTISSAESEETSEEASNISVPNSFASRASISSRNRATSRSRSVVVGEFRITVSERRAASNIFAVGSSGLRPLALKRSTIRVAVEPTGSKVAGMGEVVSMSPMWWWSRISTTSAFSTPATLCPISAWSTSSTRLGMGLRRSVLVTTPMGTFFSSTAIAAL